MRIPLISPGVWLSVPASLLMTVGILIPCMMLAYQSVIPSTGPAVFTLENYVSVLGDSYFLGILRNTLLYAAIVTAICLLIAFPVAFVVVRGSGLATSIAMALVVLPLVTSAVVRTYGWISLLGTRGFINRLLMDWGVVETPFTILFDWKGVVVGLVHVLLPFMILTISSSLRNVETSLEEASRNLGATELRTFIRITLPLIVPGISAGSLLVFVLAGSAFISVAILGGQRVKVMSLVIHDQALVTLNWPLASALSMILLVTSLLLIAVAGLITAGARRWETPS